MSGQSTLHLEPSYRLQQLELYNWGGFEGYHSADIDPAGTAIVGPTGSGKTTLVDALMTLLGTNPKYNLASTGGHESDRDLVSYVRGVAGAGDGSGGQSHIARPGKTISGISATLLGSLGEVRLAAVFSFDGSSSAATDLQKIWLFATGAQQHLQHWLTLYSEGGLRTLRQWAKDSDGLWLYANNKRNYLARARDFFEVRENAFNLLNRAAGLKQLNSIDEIFRELVLDDCAQFVRAKEVADSFDDLTAIYQEIEIARKQIAGLLPVQLYWREHQQLSENWQQQQQRCEHFPLWFAAHSHQRWQLEQQRLQQAQNLASSAVDEADAQHAQQQRLNEQLHAEYLQLGGDSIKALEEKKADRQTLRQERERKARDYQAMAAALQLNNRTERGVLQANQAQLEQSLPDWQQTADKLTEQAFEQGVTQRTLEQQLKQYSDELDDAQRHPASNIELPYRQLRAQLADALDMDEELLPFVAELVQVKPEEHAWRGAIERALGGHRLRLLVPEAQIQQALSWVNSRNNRLHVRLLEVRPVETTAQFFTDGFTRKLDYKQHPYREAVKHLLAGLDRHCVADVSLLRRTEHAMTIEGTLSGRSGFFDKQDQRRLDQDWQTGFDNQDRLRQLKQQIEHSDTELKAANSALKQARTQADDANNRLKLAERFLQLSFTEMDYLSVQKELDVIQEQLARMTAPDSDLTAARLAYEQGQARLTELDVSKTEAHKALARCQEQEKQAAGQVKQLADKLVGIEPLAYAAEFTPFAARLERCALADLLHLEREMHSELSHKRDQLANRRAQKETDLGKAMTKAQSLDHGHLAEVGTELQDVPEYLQRLQQLTEEDLPAKQQRFKAYLNRSSEDGVRQLMSEIEDEVLRIHDRLEDVNNTLQRVDFQPGRYLQIVASTIQHESLRTFNEAQNKLNSARLAEDEGESHYQALQAIVALLRDAVERQRTQPAKALLDPRFRLEFKVADIDRMTGEVIETRSGSQGGSGGEKEIIASYVLTASLSYALCPDGSRYPLFATIVLDEAFSRSSHAVAGRIIAALAEFGLHPLFVTPNKEMRLLRNHTRSAIIVHRRGQASNLTCLSWEKLDEMAQVRLHHETVHEVPH
ncbi:MAG: AAA family ATPase [Thiopseudomonas sp.]|nr:AAA family ATPase [Thiopseudomonas sp.]MCK9465420.1 AAA family ATPase [Thiopseudomonas sp.]